MPTEVAAVLLEVLVSPPSPVRPLDPPSSALESIARYLSGLGLPARVGWPEHPQALDLTAGPVLTVTHVSDRRVAVAAAPLDTSPVLWRTGELSIEAQLDLWAAYRERRNETARIVEDALDNALPWRNGLLLVSTGYHRRPLSVEASTGRNTDAGDTATVGEWRRTWMLTIRTDLVRAVPLPTQDTITVRPVTNGVTDPDLDIT